MQRRTIALILLLCGLSLASGGCSYRRGDGRATSTRVYHMPPADLQKQVKTYMQSYGFTLWENPNGTLGTDWRTYPGETYGIFPKRKQYERRTKFFLAVNALPDNTPGSLLRVDALTEQRRLNTDPWETLYDAPLEEDSPAAHMIQALDNSINDFVPKIYP